MKLYTALIRLSDSKENEVLKHDLTAAEITVLKRMHGGEAVRNIAPNSDFTLPQSDEDKKAKKKPEKRRAEVDRADDVERARLDEIYAPALRSIEAVKTLDAILGPVGVPLAQAVPGVEAPKAKAEEFA